MGDTIIFMCNRGDSKNIETVKIKVEIPKVLLDKIKPNLGNRTTQDLFLEFLHQLAHKEPDGPPPLNAA